MSKLKLNKEQAAVLEQFVKNVEISPYSPSPAAIQQRVHELESLGLEDLPEFPGISSPVRQYAINTLVSTMARDAGRSDLAPRELLTKHPGLLERADELEERYGLRPISMDELRRDGEWHEA